MGPRVIAERELISGNPAFFRVTPLGLALCRKGFRESVPDGDEKAIHDGEWCPSFFNCSHIQPGAFLDQKFHYGVCAMNRRSGHRRIAAIVDGIHVPAQVESKLRSHPGRS